jgi:hypothetical protein
MLLITLPGLEFDVVEAGLVGAGAITLFFTFAISAIGAFNLVVGFVEVWDGTLICGNG